MVLFISHSTICLTRTAVRLFSQRSTSSFKVALLGASGGIGQPLGLLLKLNPSISRLALYDIVNTAGVSADLSHIDSKAKVTAHTGTKELNDALDGTDIVVIPAGVPRKPGMTRDDLFNTNASIVRDLCDAAAKTCPKAFIAIITNPVNSTVPIAVEVFKKNHVKDTKRIFGVTTLDIIRSQTFVAELKGLDVTKTTIPVIGGHAGVTIIPVLSQTKPACKFTDEEVKSLTPRIQEAGTEVVKAKAGGGSATLSMALAAAKFVEGLLKALSGENVVQCAYVQSDVVPGLEYFSTPIMIGQNGLEKNLGTGKLSMYEENLVKTAIPELQKNIAKGIKFVRDWKRICLMLIRYLRQSSSLLFCQNEFSASIRGKLFQYNRFYSSLNDSDNKNNDENGSINLSKQGNVKEGETENESTDASAADDNLSDSLDKGELLFRKKGEKGRKKKSLKTVDIIGEEMLNAVSDISKTLHKDDVTSRKKTTYDLIAKLTEYEREKYESATAGQIEEMLAAPNIQKLFDSQQASEEKTIPKFLDSRRLKRGLFALRREMFYQAKQNGYNAKAAQDIAERAVEKARERVLSRLEKATEQKLLEKERTELKESEINDKEHKFFDLAFQVADKILYPQMRSELEKEKSKEEQPIIEPDLNMPNIFAADQPSLNVFTDISALKEHSLHYWSEWDLNAARIWNQSLGPRNGFEEMIELTEKGKMWPYPIDNEYLLGDEENVTFHEHIFLEKVIAPYNLPKQGPIAHFMELVCVGLSKNPYLTAKKKREHLDWFAQYFDKKRDEIARLHEQDQLAAQNR